MSAADELRAAATRLEETAAKATPNVCAQWTSSAVRHINRNCDITCWHPEAADPENPDDGRDHGGWDRYDDAPWISLMGPQVAAPLAYWLRDVAKGFDGLTLIGHGAAAEKLPAYAFLEVARIINRTES